jgi:hypothetical protein
MDDRLADLERALGGKLGRRDSRVVPGTATVGGVEVVYFADNGSDTPGAQFFRLTNHVNPPLFRSGGVPESGCTIRLPDGTAFHAMTYHGDLDGCCRQITKGARELGILIATISNGRLMISDGRTFELPDCKVVFT